MLMLTAKRLTLTLTPISALLSTEFYKTSFPGFSGSCWNFTTSLVRLALACLLCVLCVAGVLTRTFPTPPRSPASIWRAAAALTRGRTGQDSVGRRRKFLLINPSSCCRIISADLVFPSLSPLSGPLFPGSPYPEPTPLGGSIVLQAHLSGTLIHGTNVCEINVWESDPAIC